MDCPYWLSKLYLYNGLEDGDYAISVRGKENGSGVLVISVTEDRGKAI